MKPHAIAVLALLVGGFAYADDEFVPVLFEAQRTLQIDNASPAEACRSIANRPRGELISPPSADDRFTSSDPQSGAVLYLVRPAHDDHAESIIWTVVIEDDAENGVYRDLWIIPDTEILVFDVRCASNDEGGTAMTVRWRVTAPTERGVGEVQEFFDNDMFEIQMSQMERHLNAKFAD